jgi:hypothetical protein
MPFALKERNRCPRTLVDTLSPSRRAIFFFLKNWPRGRVWPDNKTILEMKSQLQMLTGDTKKLGLGTCQHLQLGFHFKDRLVIRPYTPTRPIVEDIAHRSTRLGLIRGVCLDDKVERAIFFFLKNCISRIVLLSGHTRPRGQFLRKKKMARSTLSSRHTQSQLQMLTGAETELLRIGRDGESVSTSVLGHLFLSFKAS